jgi:excinuclease ABC subunit A
VSQTHIVVRGAKEHNLKNVSVSIPKNRLVVITGPSGSGKSSLAFDTIYAEGQRRYIESLSAYARQFLGMQSKPDVEDIAGLSPAISIEQKGRSHNPRSTVGTVTEIYDHLRLLFGRVGVPTCPDCGEPLARYSLDQIVDLILRDYPEKKIEILSPVVRSKKGEHRNLFQQIRQKGFLRARVDSVVYWLEEEISLEKNKKHVVEIVVDRLTARADKRDRLAEAVETALAESAGFVLLVIEGGEERLLTENYVCPHCDTAFPEIDPRLFSFNNPYGACPACMGLGSHEFFPPELAVVPNRSIAEGALLPWNGPQHYMLRRLGHLAEALGWDLAGPFEKLPEEIRTSILQGHPDKVPMTYNECGVEQQYLGRYEGLLPWLERRWEETESDAVKEELARFRSEKICDACGGLRLRPEALAIKVGPYGIGDMVRMPVSHLYRAVSELDLPENARAVAHQVLEELKKRVGFLVDVGAEYLSLSRRSDTLSGGESQRIRLATQIGSKLSGVLYVLDEPTIGLHPRDTGRLLKTLEEIRDLGNTVLIVEHDRETMLAAEYLVEMGPGAGEHGGHVVAAGTPEEIAREPRCLTGPYLKGEICGAVIPPGGRRTARGALQVCGAEEHNLKSLDVSIPLGVLTCLTGVSGSGKSTFMHDVLYRGLRQRLDASFRERPGRHRTIEGYEDLRNVVLVDQSPIGRTPRSNPATYTGVFTAIRELFAALPEAKLRGYGPGRFSFNVPGHRGGRCEACKGDGVTKVSMLFLPDVYVPCDVCRGKRYNRETLEVRYRGRSIADVLDMTVDEALDLFQDLPRIAGKLGVLREAGLGYIRLGQQAPTLSGGEAQRVKLATELAKRFSGETLYLLDEPTTGLHFRDVEKLLHLLHRLVDQGNTVLLIEHNLDVLVSADHLIDLGPEGGEGGGRIVAAGTPEELAASEKGYTSGYLRSYFGELRQRTVAHERVG